MHVRSIAFAVITFAASLTITSIAHASDDVDLTHSRVVATNTGPVRGTVNAMTIAFRGIPYAAPPVGNLRWRPPEPSSRWTGVLDATRFGKYCPQLPAAADPNASESCLFLNVYLPRDSEPEDLDQKRLPVMVWIHGGANASGAGDIYDPAPLVEIGHVIVVTLNYRLGPLGFLAHPSLDTEGHPAANYGVQDQQMALKWVRTNIASFGGDPENVTLFGESAGGLNVFTHLFSQGSAGNFHRAIIQSGAYGLRAAPLSVSESLGVTFAAAIGCSDQTAACLRSTPVTEIMLHGANAFNQVTVDGRVLPEPPLAALLAGHFNRVPVMQGTNSHEGQFFVSPVLTESAYQLTILGIAAVTGKPAAQIFARYPLDAYSLSPFNAASAPVGDAAFSCTAAVSSQLLAQWVRTYSYEFNDALGSMHTVELKYLFNLHLGGSIVGPSGPPAASQLLATTMRRYWTQFAKSGNPNSPGAPEWQPISIGQIQSLTTPVPVAQSLADYRARHQCAFWD